MTSAHVKRNNTRPISMAHRVTAQAIETRIFALLNMRAHDSTLCPSEVARSLATDDGPWRTLMPQIRQVAKALADAHQLRVTRSGVEVDATDGGGPLRLGWPVGRGED